MPSLRDIKRRISSVKSTQKITRAMKMVAASKLRRAQEAIQRARPYAYTMRGLVRHVAARAERDAHPLLRPPSSESKKVAILLVTADRGLCGGFNTNLVNRLLSELRTTFRGSEYDLTIVGRKGYDLLRRRNLNLRNHFTGVGDRTGIRAAGEVIEGIVDEYASGELSEVYALYNEFKSAVQQTVILERLLPFDAPEDAEEAALDYLYEPDPAAVFDTLLRRSLEVQMHRILLESLASEHGARMTAMDAATRNAGDVIGRLTLQYNRARQDAITTQLIEVVSGAEAL